MKKSTVVRTSAVAFGVAVLATTTLPSSFASGGGTAAGADPLRLAPKHKVIKSGLENPRQLQPLSNKRLLVAQAGHGSYKKKNCSGTGEDTTCIGRSSKVSVVKQRSGKTTSPMRKLLSGAGADGSFATGADGADRGPDGTYYAIITYAPPESFPSGIPGKRAGKLLEKRPGGKTHILANITRFERKNDPDGEGFDSNPYAVLALKNKVLVADAAGDSILSVKSHGKHRGKVRLWHRMHEYGPKVDPVPTTLSLGADGYVYVGELHSEQPGKARVWKLNKQGKVMRYWGGFTTVTGVDRAANGTLYVSELFGGSCTFPQIPSCFPGQVTRVKPNGKRTHVAVPFPAGIVARDGKKVYVSAFSTSPAKGFGGNPDWSGQIWRLKY